jgi:segregation and condensation protein B
MSIKSKIEAIIYAAEEPVTLDQIGEVLRNSGLIEQLWEQDSPEAAPGPGDAKAQEKALRAKIRSSLRTIVEQLTEEYANSDHAIEIKQVANGYRMATKPEHHDVVRAFAKGLKPPMRLSLQALETLAVIAYKQPVTGPEISEIRGVDSTGVLATLLDRKLITTAGRKQVIGRPILYKTTRDFLVRFGLKDVSELPSMEEFEKMSVDGGQEELFAKNAHIADATGVPDEPEPAASSDDPEGSAHKAEA